MLQQYERTNRPKSARAAQKLVTEENSEQSVDPKVLAFRKSLAAKLKAEVVGMERNSYRKMYFFYFITYDV